MLAFLLVSRPAPAQQNAPARGDRLAVPSAAEQQKAESLIRELYEIGDDGPTLPSKALELARKLYDEATKTNDDPAGRFALLKLACNLAVEVGDAELIAQSIDHIGWPIKPSPTLAASRTAGARSAAIQIGISSRNGGSVGESSLKSAR